MGCLQTHKQRDKHFHFGKKEKILFFELLLSGTSDFNKWGVIRRVFSVKIKIAKQLAAFIPTVSSSSNFLNLYFYTFVAFPSKQIYISKVLVCNLLSFCDTFRLVYHSLRSDHNGRFFLRLYIVVVFARSLARFATTCTAVHSDMTKFNGIEPIRHLYLFFLLIGTNLKHEPLKLNATTIRSNSK